MLGGHESYVRAHALAASRLGFEPHIFVVSRRAGTVRTSIGVLHRVAAPPRGRTPVAFQAPLLARAVVRLLDGRPGPHIIHGIAIWSASAVFAARSLGRRGVAAMPVAGAYGTRAYEIGAMQAGLGPHLGLAARLRYRTWLKWVSLVDDRVEGWGYRHARVVVVNYESVRRILADAYGPRLQIRRLPYASPDAFAAPAANGGCAEPAANGGSPEPGGPPLILAVARHDPRKGLDVLLRALAGVAAAGLEFRAVMLGSGRLLDAHRRLAAELGLGDRVTIAGSVPDVRPYLRACQIFVLPSRREASGSVAILEALQWRAAVVASACDGIPEDLIDGRDALLVAPGSVRPLRDAIAALLQDPERRAALAERGHERHEQHFSAERMIAGLAELYAALGVAPARSRLDRTASAT